MILAVVGLASVSNAGWFDNNEYYKALKARVESYSEDLKSDELVKARVFLEIVEEADRELNNNKSYYQEKYPKKYYSEWDRYKFVYEKVLEKYTDEYEKDPAGLKKYTLGYAKLCYKYNKFRDKEFYKEINEDLDKWERRYGMDRLKSQYFREEAGR